MGAIVITRQNKCYLVLSA